MSLCGMEFHAYFTCHINTGAVSAICVGSRIRLTCSLEYRSIDLAGQDINVHGRELKNCHTEVQNKCPHVTISIDNLFAAISNAIGAELDLDDQHKHKPNPQECGLQTRNSEKIKP
ncbi:hypothetical protein TNCV_4763551 [Trichonephila clavipes]|nr:hypothetical protein TNCV_4763551 [Trichonephila clavipes]